MMSICPQPQLSQKGSLVKLFLTALFILASTAFAQIKNSGIEIEADEFTGERTCNQLTINPAELHSPGLHLAFNDGYYIVYISRFDLPHDEVAHNMHSETDGDMLYFKFGEGDVVSYPLAVAKAEFNEDDTADMSSTVGVIADEAFVRKLGNATNNVRYRIDASQGRYDGTLVKEQLTLLKGFVEGCQQG